MANLVRILFKQETFLKQEPVPSGQLPSNKLQKVPIGTLLVLQSFGDAASNHIKLSLKDLDFKGLTGNWHAFKGHIEIINKPFTAVTTVKQSAFNQQTKDVVEILAFINKQTAPAQGGFVKLVFNKDTIIKRQPVDASVLNANSQQKIPAGTELVLLTNQPDARNSIKFARQSNHIKFTLKDLEFNGFNQDWFAFDDHVGLQLNS